MPEGPPDRRELGRNYALAQIGFEMVVPIGIGMALDFYLGWTPAPWGVVVGTVLGLVIGITQLVAVSGRMNQEGPDKPDRDAR